MKERVLIADDNQNNLKLIKEILEDEGYTTMTASDGSTAMQMVQEFKPHVLLLDIMMPDMDGFQVCEALKKEPETKDIPIIMVTAKTGGCDLKRAFELGAFDYIKKPIDEMEVIARVQSALKFKEREDRLREMATTDGLTGLYNHALIVELFEKEVSKQERKNSDLSFVMLDIDYFKKVNDNYGHITGDFILKELADILKCLVRCGDLVGRYGGEEFSLILPDAGEENALALCERIREKVAAHLFTVGSQTLSITVSMGVYCKTGGDKTPSQDILRLADEALYRAKQNGRNRVELAPVKAGLIP